MTPPARLERWRLAVNNAAARDFDERRGALELLELLLHHEAAGADEPYRTELQRLLERVMFLLAPYGRDELYPGREPDTDIDDIDELDW
jgi:hypothetical protein